MFSADVAEAEGGFVMHGRARSNFDIYLETGEYSSGFITDVNKMITKVYKRWDLYEDADEFRGFCWTKLVRALRTYDEQDGRSFPTTLSTYLYQVIMNEARRVYSKHKKMSSVDMDDLPRQDRLWSSPAGAVGDSLSVRDRLCGFARRAYLRGVAVNQGSLFHNYLIGRMSPAVKAFMWSSALGQV